MPLVDASAVLLVYNGHVVAARQLTAIHLNAVVGKHEYEHHEQNRDEQNLLEAATQLVDHFSHVRHERENAQRSQASQQHDYLRAAVRLDLFGRQVQEQEAHREYEQVKYAAKVFDHGVGREEQAVGAHFERHLDAHEYDEHVLDNLQGYGVDEAYVGRFEPHADTRLNGHDDHDPVQVGDHAEEFVYLLVLVFQCDLIGGLTGEEKRKKIDLVI